MRGRLRYGLGILLATGACAVACSIDSLGTAPIVDGAGGGGGTGGQSGAPSGAGQAGQAGEGEGSPISAAGEGGAIGAAGSAGAPDRGAPGEAGAAGASAAAGASGAAGTNEPPPEPDNSPPIMDRIPDAGLVLGETLPPVRVHVSDDSTPAASLVVSALSDNPALVDTVTVSSGGSPDYRALNVVLQVGQVGRASITVTVTDAGGLWSSRSFQLTVLASSANETELVSRSSAPDSVLGNGESSHPSLSADGRFVAFASSSTNLVPGDTTAHQNIYVFDRQTSSIKQLTNNQGDSIDPVISADGLHVAFSSDAPDLVADDSNHASDIFVYDLAGDTVERVSVAGDGTEADGPSQRPDLSADGNFVVWSSAATNLVLGDDNAKIDIFVRDRSQDTTTRVSVSTASVEADRDSLEPQISDDGGVVAFQSQATTLVDGSVDSLGLDDIFVRGAGITRKVSTDPVTHGDANGASERPALSGDGQVVAFGSLASNLVPADDNATMDVFVFDLLKNQIERVSVTSTGQQADGFSSGPSLNVDGSRVVFDSLAVNLAQSNTGYVNCYAFDRTKQQVQLMNGSDFGGFANGSSNYRSVISNDGASVGFHSIATDIVVADHNAESDVFVTPYAP